MLVVGLGNPLFSDDGLGLRVVEELRPEFPAVHILSPTSDLLKLIFGKKRVAIVDAVKLGKEPGTIFVLNLRRVRAYPKSNTHNLSISDILTLGYTFYQEKMPEEIVLFGVEAKDIVTFKEELSKEVEGVIPELVEKIRNFLKKEENHESTGSC